MSTTYHNESSSLDRLTNWTGRCFESPTDVLSLSLSLSFYYNHTLLSFNFSCIEMFITIHLPHTYSQPNLNFNLFSIRRSRRKHKKKNFLFFYDKSPSSSSYLLIESNSYLKKCIFFLKKDEDDSDERKLIIVINR